MPIFDFKCPQEDCHEYALDAYLPLRSSEKPKCLSHGIEMEQIWSASSSLGIPTFPYVTRNITPDGSPVEVKSPGHLRELCKIHKVTPRDDNSWIEKRYEGWQMGHYDPDSGTIKGGYQKYVEGSGRGLPGSWIMILLAMILHNVI